MTTLVKEFEKRTAAAYFFIYPNAIQTTVLGLGESSNPTTLRAFMDPIVDKMSTYPGIKKSQVQRVLIPDWENLSKNAGMLSTLTGLISMGSGYMVPGPERPNKSVNVQTAVNGASRLARRHEPGQDMTLGSGVLTMDGRFLGQAEIDTPLPKIADYLKRAMPADRPDGQLRLHFNLGGKVAELGNGTSVSPAWRDSYIHVVVTGYGGAESPALREWAPNTGAYINEVSSMPIFKCSTSDSANFTRDSTSSRIGRNHSGAQTMQNSLRSNRNGILMWFSTPIQASTWIISWLRANDFASCKGSLYHKRMVFHRLQIIETLGLDM